MISEDELRALVGTQFPDGTFMVEGYMNWLTCDCVRAPELAAGPVAHPLMVYMATQGGIGLSLEELFELCHGKSEDGPMLGEWGMEVFSPVQVGTEYRVTGGITGAVRKTGKKTGVFDIIEFELQLRLAEDGQDVVAVTRSAFIFPRRG